ncbi:hypothetical protein PybrP1_003830, partial [[Pythium] brassicae (nom. inval.)]
MLPPSVTFTQIAGTFAAVAFSALAFSWISAARRKMRIANGLKNIPGPKGLPLLGTLLDITKNLGRFYEYQEDLHHKYGARVRVPWNIFANDTLFISSPEDVQHVLSTNFNNYVHSQHFQASFGRVFARSFLAINHAHTEDNGELWRLQRKVAAKVFTTGNFKVFSESIFSKYAANMVDMIKLNNGKCNMYDIATMYTLQATFDISCGLPLHE